MTSISLEPVPSILTSRDTFIADVINQTGSPRVENTAMTIAPFSLAQCGSFVHYWKVIFRRKVNPMGDIFEMAEARAHGRCPNPTDGAAKSQSKSTNFAARLLIVMDVLIYSLIEQLKEVLEAPSIGEVVRQAVRAYAIELASKGDVVSDLGFAEESYTGQLKHLNVRIPSSTRERLEFLKAKTERSYTDIIVAGLGILARSADEQENVLRKLEKETDLGTTDLSKGAKASTGHKTGKRRLAHA